MWYDKIITTLARKEVGLGIGLTLTAIVLGLIIWGNFFASSETPTMQPWQQQPVLHVCDTAPDWAQPGTEEFKQAIAFWKDHGWTFSAVESGPCPETCTGRPIDPHEETNTPCNPGKVTLDLFAGQRWKEDHFGVCVKPGKDSLGPSDWATIMVPSTVDATIPEGGLEDMPSLPKDAKALVLAHEVGHCLAGLSHNHGPSIGGCARLNPKTGHLMNPNIYKTGWGDEALPEPTW